MEATPTMTDAGMNGTFFSLFSFMDMLHKKVGLRRPPLDRILYLRATSTVLDQNVRFDLVLSDEE